VCALAAFAAAAWVSDARAFEAFDGRIQAHGFGEIQTRAIAQGYSQDLDLVQWYNVLSTELEFDILPDGWGPFDLLQAYIRAEGRYDCVWTRGCGTMRSADTYGNRAKKLPRRLADARDEDFAGTINANQQSVPPGEPLRNPHRYQVSPLAVFETTSNPICRPGQTPGASPDFCYNPNQPTTPANKPARQEIVERKGFPGFDALGRLAGADAILGVNTLQPYALSGTEVVRDTSDDPFTYLFEPIEDFRWTFRDKRGPLGSTGQTLLMGPWLPKNKVQANAVLSSRANPFRGSRTPTANALLAFGGQSGPRQNNQLSYRWTELDDQRRALFSAALAPPAALPYGFDPVDDRIARDTNGDGIFDAGQAFARLIDYPNASNVTSLNNEPFRINPLGQELPFGGDFSGIVPCFRPDVQPGSAAQQQIGAPANPPTQPVTTGGGALGCWTNVYDGVVAPGVPGGRNIANSGGRGELPMRPAPDLSNLSAFQTAAAQGVFYPSEGLRRALDDVGGAFDNAFFNFSQSDLAWNRGYAQHYTKEFKEGFLDMEFVDSRLWIRVGKQNIVWGKTELFRTTDQFNPQDLALASLPSLEESRTALWALRGVYSFYDVGPLQDVRLELAANFDHVTPADLGTCGEPFTPDIVCSLTLGYEFHGLTGVGIAGVERPPNPWNDVKGIEFGGRIEFRWDRFSVAITDFYGYQDFPHPEAINFYERNVDTVSGRPLIAEGLRGTVNSGRCRNGVPVFVRAAQLTYPNGVNAAPVPVGFVVDSGDPNAAPAPGVTPYWNALSPLTGGLGVGTDPDCLKPGGATGFPNANLLNTFDTIDTNNDGLPDRHADGQLIRLYNAPAAGRDVNMDGDFTDPGLDANGDGDFVDPGDVLPDIPPLYSPQNALEYHYANQQIYSFVCLGTVTISASVDGSSCAWTIFGSPNPLVGAPQQGPGTILSETFSSTFAGEASNTIAGNLGLLSIIQTNQKSAAALPVPIRPANRDLRDGFLTSLGGIFNVDGIPYNADSTQDLLSLDSVYTAEQRALLGCGPFYGTRCDSSRRDRGVGLSEGGGIDFLNTEASALTQSWPGIPGTMDGWSTTARTLSAGSLDPIVQPGTVGFANQSYCTRYDPSSNLSNDVGLIRLPGCRGISQLLTEDLSNLPPGDPIEFLFEAGYDPAVDGCVLGVSNPTDPNSRGIGINGIPVRALRVRAKDDPSYDPNDPVGSAEDITARLDVTCGGRGDAGTATTTRIGTDRYSSNSLYRTFAQTTWHPLAGCKTWAEANDPSDLVRTCDFTRRNFEQEFIDGTSQIFRNEMAVFSWNFLTFLVISTCDVNNGDDLNDPDCFDPRPAGVDANGRPIGNATWAPDRCSLAAPQFCRNVKGFLGVAGLQRDTVRAGGTHRFGRTDFTWHSGGELSLEYARRNVFGVSADFAEDVTKTNWGMEFTWFSDIPFVNNDSFTNVTDSQVLNLTVSVDRPTFINFLNANRTFFINSQWFFQYVTNYQGGGFTTNGPVNVLFTVAVFTGYFQDRLNPNWVFVYDFGSRSGGLLPSVGYRFTENFSVTIGLNYFFGRGQLKSMPVRGFAPTSVRAGENAYRDGVENVLSQIRRRDEAYFRLRYTF
jgi:hypothetical protein